VELKLHSFLAWELDGRGRSTSGPGNFTVGKGQSLEAGLNHLEKKKTSTPAWNIFVNNALNSRRRFHLLKLATLAQVRLDVIIT
jgi:hypothetical protein